jgi:hypothetical protein
MPRTYYDVIIIGAGLAGRIAAMLLAKKGLGVLALTLPTFRGPSVLPCSSVVNRLKTTLSGASPGLRPAARFQLITPEIRLDFHGARSIEEEFQRELPGSRDQVLDCLHQLDEWGRRLETILLQPGIPPSLGLRGNLAFRRRLLFKGLSRKGLGRKFPTLLEGISDGRARQVLLTLFAGLSLADPLHLSVAEAALLWHAAAQPQVLDGREFQKAVEWRFQQYNGAVRPLAELAALEGRGKRLQQVLLRDGRRLTAKHFFVDQLPDLSLWPETMSPKWRTCAEPPARWDLSGFDREPSDLLAGRVILSGSPPLLLTFPPSSGSGPEATVEQVGNPSQPFIDGGQVRRRLAPLLPFASYRLTCHQQPAQTALAKVRQPGMLGPQRLGPGTLFCGPLAQEGAMFDIHGTLTGWLTAAALD